MPSLKYLSVLIAALICFCCSNPELKQKTESLKDIAVPIKSIDPKDEDYSDLQFLKKIIERDSIKVIMLGEANHGDGSTFLAKSRIIKFLHKEAGFDVLAWESGLFDCTNAWERIKQNGKYNEEIRKAVFSLWTNTKECGDLLDYLQSTLATSSPLELSGFDSQITGYISQNCRVFFGQLENLHPELLTQAEENLYVKIACQEPEVTSGKDKTYNISVADKMCAKFDSLSAKDKKYEYWRQLVYGVRASYKSTLFYFENKGTLNEVFSERDIQMGNNLVWLLNNKYKNRKVIVWAASFHNSRNLSELTVHTDSLSYINNIYIKSTTMGDIVYKAMGNKMYSIFFTSYKGRYRDINKGDEEEIGKPFEGSIENVLNNLGYEFSYIDLRNPQNPDWLKGKFISRPGNVETEGVWSKVTDGIFYIEEMKPSNFH